MPINEILCIGGPLDREYYRYEGREFVWNWHDRVHMSSSYDEALIDVHRVTYRMETLRYGDITYEAYVCLGDNKVNFIEKLLLSYARSPKRNIGYGQSRGRYEERQRNDRAYQESRFAMSLNRKSSPAPKIKKGPEKLDIPDTTRHVRALPKC